MRKSLSPLRLDLKVNWKLSRNESLHKDNFLVELECDGVKGMGEVAPNVRYGETPRNIKEQFDALPEFKGPEELLSYCENAALFHSLKCGLNCAGVELLAHKNGVSIEEVLGLGPAKGLATSISVPIMEESLLENYLRDVARFPFIKIKVNEENASSFVKKISALSPRPLRIDANEGFTSANSFMRFVKEVGDLNIQFLEQPFKSSDTDSYLAIRGRCPFEVMADESIEDVADFGQLSKMFDSINIKLMKTGGPHKAIALIQKAREAGLKVMLGCMIESSLGISAAIRLGALADYYDLDGSLLIKNDPFGLIQEKEGRVALKSN